MKTERNANLKRVIVDYKKLNNTILDLLVNEYPDGYDDQNIITFRNAQNEIVECVEVKTEDTLYLVKVSKRLVSAMESHEDENDQGEETDLPEEPKME
ncbi:MULTISPECIES: hypothetical protein [Aquimarina]|uniref:hypothetical protein n=1 Tax=Aquimarina TaxID=290174 RepID=UPI0013C32C57|nr:MULTISPECIES: hypothetical protein [Aquimarina]